MKRTGVLMALAAAVVLAAGGCDGQKRQGGRDAGGRSGSANAAVPQPAATGDGASVVTAGPFTIRAAGVQVVGDGYGEGEDVLRPLNAFGKGTEVALLATVARGEILDFEEDESKLALFADNAGTNLLAGEMRYRRAGFNMMANRSPDARAVLCQVSGGSTAAPDATRIVIEAEMAFRYSPSGEHKTARAANLALVKGTKFSAGAIQLRIDEVGEPKWGDGKLEVNIKSNQDLTAIASLKFLDAAGNDIEASRSSSGRMSLMGSTTWEQSWTLKQKVDRATVVAEYWDDVTLVKVPVKLSIGLGL